MNPHQNVAVAAGQTTIRLRRSYSPELTALRSTPRLCDEDPALEHRASTRLDPGHQPTALTTDRRPASTLELDEHFDAELPPSSRLRNGQRHSTNTQLQPVAGDSGAGGWC